MVIVFDLNGTLLDTSALAPQIRAIFGRKVTVEHWFAAVLQHSMSTTLMGDFTPFGEIAISVLKMMAIGHSIQLTAEQIECVRHGMSNLPPFPDVAPALRRLRKAGFRTAVLTNSGRMSMAQQLHNSGLPELFDQTLSVESVGRYKPAPEVYRFAAQAMAIETSEILMVAAHHWDLLGAARMGCKTAFIERPLRALLPGSLRPDYVARDLKQLVHELLQTERQVSAPFVGFAAAGACGLALSLAAVAILPALLGSKRANEVSASP